MAKCMRCGVELPPEKMDKISPVPGRPQYICYKCHRLTLTDCISEKMDNMHMGLKRKDKQK